MNQVQNNNLKVGDSVILTRRTTEDDIEISSIISLDRNLLHHDDDFAGRTIYKKKIVPGVVGVALISGALTKIMGDGNVWLDLSLKFDKAVYIDDILTCKLVIAKIQRRVFTSLNVEVVNQRGEVVIIGSVSSMKTINTTAGDN